MHMHLDRRVQLLLDANRYARVELEAARRGMSVAAVIREAIDRAFAGEVGSRAEAATALLDAEPMPVDDWSDEKRRLVDELHGPARDAPADDGAA